LFFFVHYRDSGSTAAADFEWTGIEGSSIAFDLPSAYEEFSIDASRAAHSLSRLKAPVLEFRACGLQTGSNWILSELPVIRPKWQTRCKFLNLCKVFLGIDPGSPHFEITLVSTRVMAQTPLSVR
jgi:hypothetical protein